jgi:Na+/H+ antiporter NhaD/arsenite permease-like protein
MRVRRTLLFLGAFISFPTQALAAADANHNVLDLPLWTVLPFGLLLFSIGVLPLFVGHWWHNNRHKALVVCGLTLPVLCYLLYLQQVHGLPTLGALEEKALEYLSFIAMLGSLYVVAGGIAISANVPGKPNVNLAFLAFGAVLANFIGTTGASILLIRPFLRINRQRKSKWHLPVFFIFVVSNTGGLLTPFGDPPLFLGFQGGVPFAWTFTLYPQWLFVNGAVLAIFFIWDLRVFRREGAPPQALADGPVTTTFQVRGLINLIFLAGIIATVLLQGALTGPMRDILPAALMVGIGLLSLAFTPKGLRTLNAFTWEPIVEVAVLFAGIFITMIPPLAILGARGGSLGVTEPWQFFWLTGVLSSFLDNAPTYLTFATLASGGQDLGWLATNEVQVLQAISCGAVFMGALTYIGNGPNFMIKAIATEVGYEMPSFFSYLACASAVLLPVFALVTLVFFRPA